MTRRRLRLLFLLPFPPSLSGRHGGSKVTAQLIAALAARHEVGVLFLSGDGGEPEADADLLRACAWIEAVPRTPGGGVWRRRLRPKVALLSGVPTWASEVEEPRFAERLAAVTAGWRPDVVQIEFPVMGQYARGVTGAACVLVDHDASMRDLRTFNGVMRGATAALDRRAWRRFERRVLSHVDAAVVFTGRDRRALQALGPAVPVVEIPFGTPVPSQPLDPAGRPPPSILFVGNFAHPPNVDAALWLARTLFPPLREAHPDMRLTLVGPNAPAEVLELAGESTSILGEVPDVEPYLDAAAVVAAPIRVGGGMRVKVLEALAAGKAVVATPLAVEGLAVTSGEQLEVAGTADEFRDALSRLLENEAARIELGTRARAWASHHLGWDRSVTAYEALYASLLDRAPAVSPHGRA